MGRMSSEIKQSRCRSSVMTYTDLISSMDIDANISINHLKERRRLLNGRLGPVGLYFCTRFSLFLLLAPGMGAPELHSLLRAAVPFGQVDIFGPPVATDQAVPLRLLMLVLGRAHAFIAIFYFALWASLADSRMGHRFVLGTCVRNKRLRRGQ
eukprot:scaffold105199_cov17-Tisochrysis_lutea.AAC.1